MTGQEIYKLWEAFRVQSKTKKPISKVSLRQYEVAWDRWLHFCADPKVCVRWDSATSADVGRFIAAIPKRSKRTEVKTSEQTIKRYWRSLYDVYEFALVHGHVTANSADLPKRPVTVEVQSLSLAPHHWQSLSDGLPSGFTPLERRNRLMLLLTMRAALTVKELTHLSVDNIKVVDLARATFADAAAASELPLFQPESPHWQASDPHPTYSLSVDSDKSARCRTLILDSRTSKAVCDWLECRALIGKNVKFAEGDVRYLFSIGDGLKPMDPKGIYKICQLHFFKCLGEDNGIQHLGPNTLRNTCITIWHETGTPEAEIKRRLGLKADGAFRRLKDHFRPRIALN